MQILINLKVKWSGSDITTIPPAVIEPPITENPITPPSSGIIDITNLWYSTFSKGYGDLILESGKTYTLNTVKRQNINGKLNIKTTGITPAYLWVGKENYTLYVDSGEDNVLFNLEDGAEVVIKNIYPSMRKQNRNVQQAYLINWFSSPQRDVKFTALVQDCDTTYLGKNGGFGMGVTYGGTGHNYIAFINYKHAGPSLMELKNPYANSVMYTVLQNVTTDYADASLWTKRAHLTTGKLSKNNILSLTGDVETSCLYNHFFNTDIGANRSFLAHIGRFTFMIDCLPAEIDKKTIRLRPAPKVGEKVLLKRDGNGLLRFFFKDREAHVLDSFTIQGQSFTIREKLKTENDEWTNSFGGGNSPLTIKAPANLVNENTFLVNGEYTIESYISSFNQYEIDQPVYLIYKDDLNFRTTASTKFGDWQVLESRNGEHAVYNHRQVSLWAENTHIEGYYRESTNGAGISIARNLKNCTGFDDEFNLNGVTNNLPFPDRIKNLI